MKTLETDRLILNCSDNKWVVFPKSFNNSVGEVKVTNEYSGFVTLEIALNKGWEFGFAEEVIKEVTCYYFNETEFHTIRIKNSEFEKELRNCGFRPKIRGRSDCCFRLHKNETNVFNSSP